jgi:hypothetical protein
VARDHCVLQSIPSGIPASGLACDTNPATCRVLLPWTMVLGSPPSARPNRAHAILASLRRAQASRTAVDRDIRMLSIHTTLRKTRNRLSERKFKNEFPKPFIVGFFGSDISAERFARGRGGIAHHRRFRRQRRRANSSCRRLQRRRPRLPLCAPDQRGTRLLEPKSGPRWS